MSQIYNLLRWPILLLAGALLLACQGRPEKNRSQAPPALKGTNMQLPPQPIVPETIGATAGSIQLGIATSTIEFSIQPPKGPARLAQDSLRMFVRIENITAELGGPAYNVYVNLPPDADPKKHESLCVGLTPTFGLREVSLPDRGTGDGLGVQLEVTAILRRQKALGQWDGKTLRLTFEPEGWNDVPSTVKIRRVSLIIG